MTRPRVNGEGQRELDKVEEQIAAPVQNVEPFDPYNIKGPFNCSEPQTKMSTKEANAYDAPVLKPAKTMQAPNGEGKFKTFFKEEHRKAHARDRELVKVIVENKEIRGEDIEVWTRKWGCDPAEFWKVPVNKPVYMPRLLAEQLAKCKYRRLRTEDSIKQSDGFVQSYGTLIVDGIETRISAQPVGSTPVFMPA